MDRTASAAIGQISSASYGYDFDVGLPTDCDDEFWTHPDPSQDWKQPEGIPSKVSFFISHIKQSAILASALEYQYATAKTRRLYLMNLYQNLDRKLVMELDSAVNKWVDSIPEHLRNPQDRRNSIFHRQSIVLHAELHALQILMHRPFLAGTDKQLALTSIAICTNAARACSRLFDPRSSNVENVVYRVQWPIFSASVVLLLSIWSSKRMRLDESHSKQMRNIDNCIAMLRHSERRWQSSGQLVDMIQSLISASDRSLLPSQSSAGLHSAPNPPDHLRNDDSAFFSHTGHPLPSASGDGRSLHNTQMSAFNLSTDSALSSTWPFNETFGYTSRTTALQTLSQEPFHQTAPQPNLLPYPSYSGNIGLDTDLLLDVLDVDKLDVWTKAPLGLSVEEWKTYMEHVSTSSTTGPLYAP